ncbi:molybdopterin-dependent oxidoreductase [Proteinivorax hydrogeniformans]|uniref:Molybdopterin-dependent oxidoreductase n=1 Tax=Proteinivorax hydrogeniformans TaxID=1826727 RepID=A0AAU8HSE2_9FIRM
MNKKILITLGILLGVIVVFAYLNLNDREERVLSQEEAKIFINFEDERVATVNFDDMLELAQHEFEVTLRSSSSPNKDNTYKGILMKDLLSKYDINLDDINQVITRAADGYTVALTQSEILDKDNVYIVYKENGEYLAPREDGGSGPYQVVIKQDQFGQRWNKFLMELDVN